MIGAARLDTVCPPAGSRETPAGPGNSGPGTGILKSRPGSRGNPGRVRLGSGRESRGFSVSGRLDRGHLRPMAFSPSFRFRPADPEPHPLLPHQLYPLLMGPSDDEQRRWLHSKDGYHCQSSSGTETVPDGSLLYKYRVRGYHECNADTCRCVKRVCSSQQFRILLVAELHSPRTTKRTTRVDVGLSYATAGVDSATPGAG